MRTFLCIGCMAALCFADAAVKEVRINMYGELKEVVVDVGDYDVVVNARGKVVSVETDAVCGTAKKCVFDRGGIKRSTPGTGQCTFRDGKLYEVGDYRVVYTNEDQIEELGKVKFTYESLDRRPGKVLSAGAIYFFWYQGHNQLKAVNDVVFSYDDNINFITEISSKFLALGEWFAKYKVKIIVDAPVEVFTE